MYVPIGGIDQYLRISEDMPERPVLLFLHGGPGATTLPAAGAWQPWEDHFTLVHWDQRGANRTFRRNGADGCGPLTIDRMVSDGVEVAEFLMAHLKRPKILLVGHSWGSALGTLMILRRPDLFSAFVGTGQYVNLVGAQQHSYRHYLAQAEKAGNEEALAVLREIGPPPYTNPNNARALFDWCDRLTVCDGDPVQPRPTRRSPDFSADEVPLMLEGFAFSAKNLYGELSALDLNNCGLKYEIPIFVFQGTEDPRTPLELAEDYFARIEAPHKEFVRFEGCHHFVVMNRPEDFLRELLARVKPRL